MTDDITPLLDDRGRVDPSAIRARVLDGDGEYRAADAKTCAEWRRELRGATDATAVAERYDHSANTIRNHITGRCSHDIKTPTLRFARDMDTFAGIWVVDDE